MSLDAWCWCGCFHYRPNYVCFYGCSIRLAIPLRLWSADKSSRQIEVDFLISSWHPRGASQNVGHSATKASSAKPTPGNQQGQDFFSGQFRKAREKEALDCYYHSSFLSTSPTKRMPKLFGVERHWSSSGACIEDAILFQKTYYSYILHIFEKLLGLKYQMCPTYLWTK